MLLFVSFIRPVYADVTNGLMVSRVSIGQKEIHPNHSFTISAEVLELKAKQENGGDLDKADLFPDAVVTAMITNGAQEIKINLQHEGRGKYKGKASLPKEGKWKLVVTAMYKKDSNNHAESESWPDLSAQNVLDTVIEVKAGKPINFWSFIAGICSIIGITSWLIIRLNFQSK